MTRRLRSDDEGAVLITVGIFLLALMVFAAWAVDISSVLVERRSAQNTADVSALSAAQLTLRQTPAAASAAAEAEARRLSAINFGTTDDDWNGCSDADRPAKFTVIALTTDCVSFTAAFDEIRVRVPDRDVPTVFAGVIGINSIATSAFAEVATTTGEFGGILPFGLPPGSGGETCLKAGAQTLPSPPCDGPDDGNFGFLDFKLYRGLSPNACSTGSLIENISDGVDHWLDTRDNDPSFVHDFDFCPNTQAFPDRTNSQPGNTATLHQGLVASSSPTARLQRGANDKLLVLEKLLDDRPLWEYITTGSGDCEAIPGWDHDDMNTCIASNGVDPVTHELVFAKDIRFSPRFAWVPEVHIDFVTGGSTVYEFLSFKPVYVQTIYANCTASDCNEFNPGEVSTITGNGSGGNGVKVATVILIPLATLDDEIQAHQPGTDGVFDFLLSR